MSRLLDFLTLPLSLPISPLWDVVICLVIGEIAYRVAFAVAGEHADSVSGRSALHWLIRIPLWFLMWLFVCLIITIVDLIRENWMWAFAVLAFIAVVVGIIMLIKRHQRG